MSIKAVLVKIWNKLYDVKIKITECRYRVFDFFYNRTHKPPQIMTCEETVKYILETGCSVARFGDGEMKLVSGRDLLFQKATPRIKSKLKEVIGSDKENLLVCLPSVFSDEQLSNRNDAAYWKKHLSYSRRYWYKNLIEGKVYGNAFISRYYINLKDRKTGVGEYFQLVKKLWEDKDIIIVEGEKSRLGMGNDLFDNAKSVRRILAPSAQCFSKYDEILAEIKKHGTKPLYILALGPTASIMPIDLCDLGYHVIDMGNIDTEYEWFRMGATEKTPIKNKMVYEAGAGAGVGDVDDEKYNSEIIAKIL